MTGQYNLRSMKSISASISMSSSDTESEGSQQAFEPILEQPIVVQPIMDDGAEPSNRDLMRILQGNAVKLLKLDTIEKELISVKEDQKEMKKDISAIDGRVTTLEAAGSTEETKINDALKKIQIPAIASEYNSKQYNIFNYNLPQQGDTKVPRNRVNWSQESYVWP